MEAIVGSRFYCNRSAGTIAKAENHRANAATNAKVTIAKDISRPPPMPIPYLALSDYAETSRRDFPPPTSLVR